MLNVCFARLSLGENKSSYSLNALLFPSSHANNSPFAPGLFNEIMNVLLSPGWSEGTLSSFIGRIDRDGNLSNNSSFTGEEGLLPVFETFTVAPTGQVSSV